MSKELLLVGSIPYDTAEDVFRNYGAPLGPHLDSLPDGEVGLRRHWISRVHYQVLAGHPSIETVRQPKLEDGRERQEPRDASDSWQFKIKDGVDRIRFADPGWRLGYARDAVNSYFVFKTLREKGVIAEHLRFQVSIPSVNSAVPPRVFTNLSDVDIVREGFGVAVAAEIENIVERIPAKDLAIQWDCATEMQDAYGAIPGYEKDDAIDRNMPQFAAHSPLIPDDALLGFHLCFGTLGGWPRFEPEDLSGAVTMANAFAEGAGRRVDWIHIPVLDRTDAAFFAPLANLNPRGARIYLGAIHNMAGFADRIALARKFFPDFGVAAYCGLGRNDPSELPDLIDDHQKAVGLTRPG